MNRKLTQPPTNIPEQQETYKQAFQLLQQTQQELSRRVTQQSYHLLRLEARLETVQRRTSPPATQRKTPLRPCLFHPLVPHRTYERSNPKKRYKGTGQTQHKKQRSIDFQYLLFPLLILLLALQIPQLF